MTLSIHRSDRADALVRGLGELLTSVPADPFTPDLVAVPSLGVERWIAQTLSTSLGAAAGAADGICANVLFPNPSRLVADAVAVASGIDPDQDPWREERLTWHLLDVVDRCATEPWCRTLGRHLGLVDGAVDGAGKGAGDRGRRVATAQKLAGLFTAYGVQRPSLLREWAAGEDTDGDGYPLDEDLAWQAELWRRLRASVGVESPAERVDAACRRLRDEPSLVVLPERFSVFGPTRLTSDQVQVLAALGEHRDVHLWLSHPSHVLWDRVARDAPVVTRRRDDPTAALPQHPLIGSCGRDAREMQVRLAAAGGVPAVDEYLPVGEGSRPARPAGGPARPAGGPARPAGDPARPVGTLLGALQEDLRLDRAPSRHDLRAGDRSLQVHACHGRQREVEVLREVLLGLLEDDPTLEPRDVIVMCPDIEAYAPLITAAFGLDVDTLDEAGRPSTSHPGHRLRVRLADRALKQTNPVLTVVARLLDLADARLTGPEVLDLAAQPAVRARFDFDDDELERVGDWVRRAGVRWGLDAADRAPYHLDGVPQNTWQTGLDRVLVGVTMDEEELRTVGLALPLDDVDSNEADLAGRFAELVDRLALTVEALRVPQSLDAWVDTLVTAVDALTWTPPFDAWQTAEARRELTDVLTSAGDGASAALLGLADVRALLARRLRGRPTRANFRTGQLTMCTMVPMRSVPHRVVCLLGVNDGVFPRGTHADGDDVLGRSPRVGERDVRSEDRQLFLDAVLAARETLVVLYTGADERTGAVRPPAVPLGELLDVVDRMVPGESVLVRHPLQPFDARNFVDGDLGAPGPFSFDAASYDGARALRGPRRAATVFLDRPLPPVADGDVVELDDLVRFLEAPVKTFLRQRLGLSTFSEDDDPAEAVPIELDHLERYHVGDRLLEHRLAGVPRGQVVRAEWLRGDLPPGPLGESIVTPVADEVDALVSQTEGLRAGGAVVLDATVTLPGGTRVSGTVPGVHGDRLVRVVYSKLGAKHRLRAWAQLLLVVAAHGDRSWSAATVGRGSQGQGPTLSQLVPPTPADAAARLAELVAVYRAGLESPLPLAPKTSCAYADKRHRGSPVAASTLKAEGEWRRSYQGREIGEFDDTEHLRVWGDSPLDALLVAPARADLPWAEEGRLFGQLARTVWEPLLTHERIVVA